MRFRRGFVDAIGHTPLIRLERLSAEPGCNILGKAEFMNVGGSIKDRAALSIIRKARASGALKPGGVIYGDDYGKKGGVAEAVDELYPHRKLLGLSQYAIG